MEIRDLPREEFDRKRNGTMLRGTIKSFSTDRFELFDLARVAFHLSFSLA